MKVLRCLTILFFSANAMSSMRPPSAQVSLSEVKNILQSPQNLSPSIVQCSEPVRNESVLYQECARSLCGEPSQSPSIVMNDSSFARQPRARLPDEAELRTRLGNVLASQADAVREATTRLRQEFVNMNQSSRNESASQMFGPYFKFEADTSRPINERLTIKYFPPYPVEGFEQGLSEYAENLKSFYIEYPFRLGNMGFLTESEALLYPWQNIQEPDLCQARCREALFASSPIKRLEESLSSTDHVSESVDRCVDMFRLEAFYEQQRADYNGRKTEIIDEYVSRALGSLSEHSRAEFRRQFVDEVDFVGRPLFDLPQRSTLAQAESSPRTIQGSELLAAFETNPSFDLATASGICQAPRIIEAYDKVIHKGQTYLSGDTGSSPDRDAVMISNFTYFAPHLGKGVVFHEISHLFHAFVLGPTVSQESRAMIMEKLACIAGRNPATQTILGNEFNFTSEDFADYFATLALGEGDGHFTCVTLRASGDEYVDLRLDTSPEQFYSSHSPGLVRIIREAMLRNKPLSPACQAVIKSERSNLFSSCNE
jgi:hypothetical protein